VPRTQIFWLTTGLESGSKLISESQISCVRLILVNKGWWLTQAFHSGFLEALGRLRFLLYLHRSN
jgi:hypothetical protein